MKPPKNGKTADVVRIGRVKKATPVSATKSIGNVPKDFNAAEKQVWKTLLAELPYLNLMHRPRVIELTTLLARARKITAHFRRRMNEFEARKEDPALALLDDNGKRSPMMMELLAHEKEIRLSLDKLEATADAQLAMLSDIGESKADVAAQQERQRFFT